MRVRGIFLEQRLLYICPGDHKFIVGAGIVRPALAFAQCIEAIGKGAYGSAPGAALCQQASRVLFAVQVQAADQLVQGFPDWWCSGLETPQPTKADIEFWTEVWETHRRAVNPSVKPKTERQIVKWLKAPYSDAAEYKMWGNGVALPCVWFVLSGIVFSTQLSPA